MKKGNCKKLVQRYMSYNIAFIVLYACALGCMNKQGSGSSKSKSPLMHTDSIDTGNEDENKGNSGGGNSTHPNQSKTESKTEESPTPLTNGPLTNFGKDHIVKGKKRGQTFGGTNSTHPNTRKTEDPINPVEAPLTSSHKKKPSSRPTDINQLNQGGSYKMKLVNSSKAPKVYKENVLKDKSNITTNLNYQKSSSIKTEDLGDIDNPVIENKDIDVIHPNNLGSNNTDQDIQQNYDNNNKSEQDVLGDSYMHDEKLNRRYQKYLKELKEVSDSYETKIEKTLLAVEHEKKEKNNSAEQDKCIFLEKIREIEKERRSLFLFEQEYNRIYDEDMESLNRSIDKSRQDINKVNNEPYKKNINFNTKLTTRSFDFKINITPELAQNKNIRSIKNQNFNYVYTSKVSPGIKKENMKPNNTDPISIKNNNDSLECKKRTLSAKVNQEIEVIIDGYDKRTSSRLNTSILKSIEKGWATFKEYPSIFDDKNLPYNGGSKIIQFNVRNNMSESLIKDDNISLHEFKLQLKNFIKNIKNLIEEEEQKFYQALMNLELELKNNHEKREL